MSRAFALPLIVVLLVGSASAAETTKPPVSTTVLDDAFRIASAIASDPRDRSRAQESVTLDLAMLGRLDEAARLADGIEGWRRAVAYSEIANMTARSGRLADARALVARARAARGESEGWEASRVDAHIARSEAMIGEMSRTREVAERLIAEDDQQYAGLPAIMRASAHAAKGEIEQALTDLAGAGTTAIEMAPWRTTAYLDVARSLRATAEQRTRAIDAARASARTIEEVISRIDALESVAAASHEAALDDRAAGVLDEAYAIVAGLPDSTALKAPFLAGQARVLAAMGTSDRARILLSEAVAVAPSAANLDRPAIWANIAAGYRAAGDDAQADRLLARALDEADALANARPRALAAVEICRAIARFDIPFEDSTRRRIAALIAGLKAPW